MHWTDFGIRRMPPMSGRTRITELPPQLQPIVDERVAHLDQPISGITSDGVVRHGLYGLHAATSSLAPLVDAARAFLEILDDGQRSRAQQPLDSEHWRTWINVHLNLFRHGVMLEELDASGRQLGLALLRETLSARGFAQARDIMRLNQFVSELTKRPDEFGEWLYFVTVFGDPGTDEPWGWQIDGHHLIVNCVVVGHHLVLTPTFMGSEPCHVHTGPFAGTRVFAAEERSGLDLVRTLDEHQRSQAIVRPSIHPDDLPPDLRHPFDGRMLGGAFHDNAVIPTDGIAATDLSETQRHLLLDLASTYVGWTRDEHNEVRMDEVVRHLDETWFSWMGSTGHGEPFYYRVQSPVLLIEFDHHPGVVFDNGVPSRNHVHTVVRTPNGGDYGVDLLRQHHDRFDHAHGDHRRRDQIEQTTPTERTS